MAATLVGEPSVKGSTETVRMALLTFALIGITFTWGVEMTYCTPYLLKLGLTKSNTSLIWIAGPLSGLVVQPITGVISDENTSRWGRRRPLMAASAGIVALGLLTLGFAPDIVGLMVGPDGEARTLTIVLAVLAIYVVDFAINVVMSCSRSLIVDVLPLERQQTGAAWASRMGAVGHAIGYAAGSADLVRLFGTAMGGDQFKQLIVIATVAILGSTGVTCWAVTESVLVSPSETKDRSLVYVLRQVYSTIRHLPPRVQAICRAQFWAWIGWFPFLFYSTTWVGETYFRYDVPARGARPEDALGDMGRVGSASLLIYSAITLAGAFVLPLLVKSLDDESFTRRPPQAIARLAETWSDRKPDLVTTWMCGHLLFAASMALAPFATSYRFATVLVCLCGLPWTIASWAPPALLGVEVNRISRAAENGAYRRLDGEPDTELAVLGPGDAPLSPTSRQGRADADKSPTAELSGVYFGVLNVFTTLPQFVGTFIASVVFAVLEPGKSPELAGEGGRGGGAKGPNAIAVCLFIGAMSALAAAFATRRLRE